jgi:hypothetical protein
MVDREESPLVFRRLEASDWLVGVLFNAEIGVEEGGSVARPFTRVVLPLLVAGIGVVGYWGVIRTLGSDGARAASRLSTFETTVYFLTDGGRAPLGVRRTLVKQRPSQGASLRAAIASLLAGPTRSERRAGIASAIPSGTHLLSLSFKGRGGSDAVLNLHGLPPDAPGWQTARSLLRSPGRRSDCPASAGCGCATTAMSGACVMSRAGS